MRGSIEKDSPTDTNKFYTITMNVQSQNGQATVIFEDIRVKNVELEMRAVDENGNPAPDAEITLKLRGRNIHEGIDDDTIQLLVRNSIIIMEDRGGFSLELLPLSNAQANPDRALDVEGDLTILGGVVSIKNAMGMNGIIAHSVTIAGGDVTAEGAMAGIGLLENGKVTMTGGKLLAKSFYASNPEPELSDDASYQMLVSIAHAIMCADQNETFTPGTLVLDMPASAFRAWQVNGAEMQPCTLEANEANGLKVQVAVEVLPPIPVHPQTGDSANLTLWACLLALSAAGFVLLGKRRLHG